MKSLLFVGALMMMAAMTGATEIQSPVALPAGWVVREGVKPNMNDRIQTTLVLRRRNVDKLEKTLLEVSDPKHASYQQHWSVEQVRDLITPGQKTIDSVKSWLAGNNAQSVKVAKTEDVITFTATRAELSKMFEVEWSFVQNPKTGVATFATLGAINVPKHLANDITTVTGLFNFPSPKFQPRNSQSAASGAITPKGLAQVYNITETISRSDNLQSFFQSEGQAVSAADTTQFCQQYLGADYSGPCSIARYVGGTDAPTPGIESALDSQYILGVGRATTWAYTYNSDDFCSDLTTWAQRVLAESTFPYVISMSYGAESFPGVCPSIRTNLNVDMMKVGVMGITVVIASGDCGSAYYTRTTSAYCDGYNDGRLSPSFPADMPYVTAVGATQFQNGLTGEESASFSGGGYSFTYDIPSYQQDAVASYMSSLTKKPQGIYNYNSTNKGRATPDVALVGVNFQIINSEDPTVSGTSASTPTFGGIVTQLNNIALESGKTMGFINPFLYQNADCFNDITTGSNANGYAGHGWDAIKGWDAATGLGSPNWGCLASRIKGGHIPTQGPTTQAPPTPPTPAPPVTTAPAGGTFTQKICTNSDCTTGCQSHTLPQGQCLQLNGGGSAIAECSATDLTLTEYPISSDCSGFSEKATQPINQCLKDEQGSYLENQCSGSTPGTPSAAPSSPPVGTPTPGGSSGSFTQKTCTNSACTEGCQSHVFPEGQCLKLQGGGSAKAECTSQDVTLTEYPLSDDCSGFSIPTTQPVNQCVQDDQGSYLENICSSQQILKATGALKSLKSKKVKALNARADKL